MPPAPRPPPLGTPAIRAPGSGKIRAVAALLRDFGAQIHPGGTPTESPTLLPTGLAPLDRLLGGGFPRGRLCEITGRPGSGRTALALALLARATTAGDAVAVVDVADAFDPSSACGAGVELARVLWVRPPSRREALRSAERLLEARGFGLVLLDLASATEWCAQRAAGERNPSAATWIRLARRAAAAGTTLVLLARDRLAGTFAELAVETRPVRARFAGPPSWLEGLEVRVVLARSRSRPAGGNVALPLRSEPAVDAT